MQGTENVQPTQEQAWPVPTSSLVPTTSPVSTPACQKDAIQLNGPWRLCWAAVAGTKGQPINKRTALIWLHNNGSFFKSGPVSPTTAQAAIAVWDRLFSHLGKAPKICTCTTFAAGSDGSCCAKLRQKALKEWGMLRAGKENKNVAQGQEQTPKSDAAVAKSPQGNSLKAPAFILEVLEAMKDCRIEDLLFKMDCFQEHACYGCFM